MKTVDWYFDFISPFAYIASQRLSILGNDVVINPTPVLFAGLLNHFDTKGPAEIAPMRQYTFRHVTWLAKTQGIDLNLPPAHPFNPLKLLRLALYLESDLSAIDRIFRFVWQEGKASDDGVYWKQLTEELGVRDADNEISQPSIKKALIRNTEKAIEVGVFGVPTFTVDGECFFGQDSMPFLMEYLNDSTILESTAMQAADTLPEGVKRRQ